MTPAPNLQELIEIVLADAESDDPLRQLGQAAQTAGSLEDVTDALLGHFVDRARRSGHSWSEISAVIRVTKQAAHKRFWSAPPTFERFTPRARGVVADAAVQARSLRHRSVGSEDLLLALFEPAEAIAAQVLSEAGIERSAVIERIRIAEGDGTPPTTEPLTPPSEETPFSPAAIDVLRRTLQEALQLGHNYIGTEHLLLGLFNDDNDGASAILDGLGMSYPDCKDRVEAKLARYTR